MKVDVSTGDVPQGLELPRVRVVERQRARQSGPRGAGQLVKLE
jgi:hypothetical protein